MLYLTTHSTHFIYGPETSRLGKEGNALFNDTLNTFYLRSRNIQTREGRKCFI